MTMHQSIQTALREHLPPKEQDVVIICIGTDRCTGDSLGPFVGEFLSEKNLPRTYIYGTIQQPVMALNLRETMRNVKKKHPDAFIIGIDAGLGEEERVGEVIVRKEPIRPGAAFGKRLPDVGDLSIIAVVSKMHQDSQKNYKSLSNTRLQFVLKIAKEITLAIEGAMCEEDVSNIISFPKKQHRVVSEKAYEKRYKKRSIKERFLEKLYRFSNQERLS